MGTCPSGHRAGILLAKRVLVVDDEAEIRRLIGRVLSEDGYEVDVAANLAEARKMNPGRYAAVLVDARLGAERGMDLIDELRAAGPAAASRCLVITGGETRTGPDGLRFLAKPFRPAELLAAVRALAEPAPGAAAGPAPGRKAGPAPGHGTGPAASELGTPADLTAGPASSGPAPPSARAAQVTQLLAIARHLRARERRELVDYLHDGPLQDLTAATLEAQLMSSGVPDGVATRFAAVLRQLDAVARALRWLVDGDLPFSQPEIQLASALQQRTAWLLDVPLTVRAEGAAAGLAAADVPTVVDVVELLLLGMLPAGHAAQACVLVHGVPNLIQLELTLVPAAHGQLPASDLAAARVALDELAGALGTTAQAEFCAERWLARITLPAGRPDK